MILSELLKPVFLYVVIPVLISAGMYFKGYSSGYESARLEYQKAEKQVASSLRKAEEKNEGLRYAREMERIKVNDSGLSTVVCLFNAYFSGQAGNCYSPKADPSVN